MVLPLRCHYPGTPKGKEGHSKYDFYLRGLPAFTVLTYHRSLVGNFCKQLHELDNAPLMRMREILTSFSFDVKWVKGKTHMIADALLRMPVFQPEEEEEETHKTCLQVPQACKLMDIEQAIDDHYNVIVLVLAIKSDANFKQLPGHPTACKLLNVCDQLSIAKLGQTDVIILDSRRIVVPKGAQKNYHPGAAQLSLIHI